MLSEYGTSKSKKKKEDNGLGKRKYSKEKVVKDFLVHRSRKTNKL